MSQENAKKKMGEVVQVLGNLLVDGDVYLKASNFASLHYGNRGRLGQTPNFNPDKNRNGLWIEGSDNGHGRDSGGLFMNGNTMCLWSPGDNDLLRIYDEDNFGSASLKPKFVIDNDGRVGIGTATPNGTLEVKSDSDPISIKVENTYHDEDYYGGEGVFASAVGLNSKGVHASARSEGSVGVSASAKGTNSAGVRAYASGEISTAVYAQASGGGSYGFFTGDNIYVGGKIDLVGEIDPIIVECFNADPAVADYEVGDVVCLDEGSPYVKICDKAHDTKVVGVVGPTHEIKDGEISVVIMGYRGAKPDTEHVKALERRLEETEPRMAEFVKRKTGSEMVNVEKEEENKSRENEITMLKSGINKAKSITRLVVKIKVDASHAPIKRGDLLTSSPTKGHAMKAKPVEISGVEIHRPGTIIGKAMEPLESGTGLIDVFVALQ